MKRSKKYLQDFEIRLFWIERYPCVLYLRICSGSNITNIVCLKFLDRRVRPRSNAKDGALIFKERLRISMDTFTVCLCVCIH